MKIAQIAYTNTAPFFYQWPEDRFALQPGVPSELAKLAREGEIVAGPIPIVEFWKMENTFEPLLDFGISCRSKCHSVLVFSKQPFAELNRVSIGVTRDSATSVALCHALLEQRYQHTVRFRKGLQMEDAAWLVIGDQALKMAAQSQVAQWTYVTDLATEWWKWQKKPFVFARWVIRRDTKAAVRAELEQLIKDQFHTNMNRLSEVSEDAADRTGLPVKLIETYLNNFEYRLGAEATDSMGIFRELNNVGVKTGGSIS